EGDSFTTRRPISDFSQFGFNDRASSVVVGGEADARWQICDDVRFSGRCVILSPGRYPTLRAMGLNNGISSVQLLARAVAPLQPVAAAPSTLKAVFYEKPGLSGRSMVAQEDIASLRRTGFDERISSMEIFGGPWEVCQDDGFAGRCAVLRPGRYPSLAEMGLDNRISSMRIVMREHGPGADPARVVFYGQENFAGRSFATQGERTDFGGSRVNDRASSAQVYGGPWELCPDSGYGGACVVLRAGNYPSLRAIGLNNSVSSARVVGLEAGPTVGRPNTPPVALYDPRRRNNERLYQANVTEVRAVVGPPDQRCWVEPDQIARERSTNVPGAVIGAVIGGILGHQVGNGRGRDLATIGGVIAGGAVGATVGRDGQPQPQDVQRCTSTPSQARPELWDVTYNFRGQDHRVQMTTEPGPTITVNQQGEPRI
ncbi:MAG: beta/gamma crystallin-related protein, partial [Burkholderiaceae bacterium]